MAVRGKGATLASRKRLHVVLVFVLIAFSAAWLTWLLPRLSRIIIGAAGSDDKHSSDSRPAAPTEADEVATAWGTSGTAAAADAALADIVSRVDRLSSRLGQVATSQRGAAPFAADGDDAWPETPSSDRRSPASPSAQVAKPLSVRLAETTAPPLPAPVPARAPAALTALADAPLLLIGIPTIHRGEGEDYLARTLRYIGAGCAQPAAASPSDWFHSLPGFAPALLARECLAPGPHPLRLRVLAMNNLRAEAGQHVVWAQARDASCAAGGDGSSDPLAAGCRKLEHLGGVHTAFLPAAPAAAQRLAPGPRAASVGSDGGLGWPSGMVAWVQNGRPVQADGNDEGSPNVPGARVRRQTRDVCDLLDAAQALAVGEGSSAAGAAGAQQPSLAHTQQPGSQLQAGRASSSFMFMEDDFRLCPRGVEALAYLLAKAQAVHPDWNEIRVSFGLNGGIIRASDVPVLAAYFREHLARRPPDHLFVEWFAGETPQSSAQKRRRPHLAFRYNLLEHFGFKSSLRSQVSPVYAFCYDLLNDGVVFAVEAFKPNECPMDDVWPCKPPGQAPAVPHRIPFAELAANARTDTVQRWAGQQ